MRVRDEDAPKAKSGLRPKASITAQAGAQYAAIKIPFGGSSSQQAGAASGASGDFQDTYVGYPRGATLNMSQTLFDGFRTENSVRQAESGVFAARSTMRLTEQATLQNGATAYMNVLRDTAVVSLRKNNISVLEEQLKQSRDRFQVGEVTRTDVAQAEASVALARSEFYAAQAQLKNSMANYRQIIGAEPKHLEPGRSLEPLLPKSLEQAIAIALVEHPGVTAAFHQVDAAALAVKVAEGALAPNLSVNGQVSNQYDSFLGLPGSKQFTASAISAVECPALSGRRPNMPQFAKPRSNSARRGLMPTFSARASAQASFRATDSSTPPRRRSSLGRRR